MVDTTPLRRHRDFRLLVSARFISALGSMVTMVAVPYQLYRLTGSSLAVGLLGLFELAPILAVAFYGGAMADAFDRRRLVLLAEAGAGLASGLLVLNATLSHPHVWIVYVAAVAGAAFYAILRPALDAMPPRLVDHEELPAAAAIGTAGYTVAWLGGPALGGVLIAAAGLPVVYGLDVVSFGASLLLVARMRRMPPPEDAERPSIRRVREGLAYAASRQELIGTYAVDIVALLFGVPEALFPAYAEHYGGAGVLGLLFSAPALGGLLASVSSGWIGRVHRHGMAVILAASGWGVGVIVFGAASVLWLALAGLVIAGFADAISGIFRSTIWNQTIPDRLRGRLAGVEMVSYTTGPLLGNVESGIVAALTTVRFSAISGGVLCIAGVAVTAILLPAFRMYDSRTMSR
jgi:MFS family permease